MPVQFHRQLSVVIPVYNVARYLRACLDSALAQAPYLREIVVVDDGSVDDSAAVAESYGPPVRVIRVPHGGIGAARNRGLAVASGDFIAILDADDMWTLGSIEQRFDAFAADPALDVVSGHMIEFHSEDLLPAERARLVAHTSPRSGYCPGTVVFRRALVDAVGPFREDIKISEFIEWMGRVNERGARCVVIPRTVLRRRIHATNSSHVHPVTALDYVRVMRETLARRRRNTDGGAP